MMMLEIMTEVLKIFPPFKLCVCFNFHRSLGLFWDIEKAIYSKNYSLMPKFIIIIIEIINESNTHRSNNKSISGHYSFVKHALIYRCYVFWHYHMLGNREWVNERLELAIFPHHSLSANEFHKWAILAARVVSQWLIFWIITNILAIHACKTTPWEQFRVVSNVICYREWNCADFWHCVNASTVLGED